MLTRAEVSEKSVVHNLKQFKKLIGKGKLLMPVVKSNAYGHGIIDIAKICQKSGLADKLCVASLGEARELISNGIRLPIVILSMYEPDEKAIAAAANKGVAFPLYTIEQAKLLNKAGGIIKKKIKAHLKIDTGTSRVGLLQNQIIPFLKKIKNFKNLELEGIWSHFSSSETDAALTKQQWNKFKSSADAAEKEWGRPIPLRHMACSAALILHPYAHANAVRLGLGLYGLYPSEKSKERINLLPALSWKTTLVQIKKIPAGAKVSYGGTYKTKKSIVIGILPVGYFDGYDRGLSNKARVLVKGRRCAVLGRICMNLTMIDVSMVPGVKAGDMATLIGKDGREKISADELAALSGTINYEIISRINPLINRVITK